MLRRWVPPFFVRVAASWGWGGEGGAGGTALTLCVTARYTSSLFLPSLPPFCSTPRLVAHSVQVPHYKVTCLPEVNVQKPRPLLGFFGGTLEAMGDSDLCESMA